MNFGRFSHITSVNLFPPKVQIKFSKHTDPTKCIISLLCGQEIMWVCFTNDTIDQKHLSVAAPPACWTYCSCDVVWLHNVIYVMLWCQWRHIRMPHNVMINSNKKTPEITFFDLMTLTLTIKLVWDIIKVNPSTKFHDPTPNGSAMRALTDRLWDTDGSVFITSTADAGGNDIVFFLIEPPVILDLFRGGKIFILPTVHSHLIITGHSQPIDPMQNENLTVLCWGMPFLLSHLHS